MTVAKIKSTSSLMFKSIWLVWTQLANLISVFDKLGKMSPGQMFPGQISLWQLSIVKEDHGKLALKFGQNRMRNRQVIADFDFLVVVGVGGLKSFSCKIQLRLCQIYNQVIETSTQPQLNSLNLEDKCYHPYYTGCPKIKFTSCTQFYK